MKVIVDTSVWSLALRRIVPKTDVLVATLSELINESRVQMLGSIRQELLSGIKQEAQFKQLRNYLQAFPDLAMHEPDFEEAAHYFNICRNKGIQGSNTDFLLCSASVRHNMPIFTSDKDFELYSKVIPIKLFQPDVNMSH